MLCANCKTELSFQFKHAFVKNECPACGKEIMDEESLALIEDIKSFLLSEATIRDETAHKLAMSLIARYSISSRVVVQRPTKSIDVEVNDEKPKAVVSEQIQQQLKALKGIETNVVEKQVVISDSERERIAEEAIREKYAMVDKVQGIAFADTSYDQEFDIEEPYDDTDFGNQNAPLFSDEINSAVLEQGRRARLLAQQDVMNGGTTKTGKPAAFRRA